MNNHVYLIHVSQFYFANTCILVSNILSIIIMIIILKILIFLLAIKNYTLLHLCLWWMLLESRWRPDLPEPSTRTLWLLPIHPRQSKHSVQIPLYRLIHVECLTTGESLVNILSSEDSYAPKSTFSFLITAWLFKVLEWFWHTPYLSEWHSVGGWSVRSVFQCGPVN